MWDVGIKQEFTGKFKNKAQVQWFQNSDRYKSLSNNMFYLFHRSFNISAVDGVTQYGLPSGLMTSSSPCTSNLLIFIG